MDTWEKVIIALGILLSMGIGVEIGIRYTRKRVLLWLLEINACVTASMFVDKFYERLDD